MQHKNWLAAKSDDGLETAEQYIAQAKTLRDPIASIDQILLSIDLMQKHIGRMDTESEYLRLTAQHAKGNGAAEPARARAVTR